MKIRAGFVSNSSSSSFVAWGVSVDQIVLPDKFYLDIFYAEILELESMKKLQEKRFKSYYSNDYENMVSCENEEEKIEYVKNHLMSEELFSKGEFEVGGEESNFVGISPSDMVRNHPEIKFGEVKKFVALKLNETFGTNFASDDISYVEEGWYNG